MLHMLFGSKPRGRSLAEDNELLRALLAKEQRARVLAQDLLQAEHLRAGLLEQQLLHAAAAAHELGESLCLYLSATSPSHAALGGLFGQQPVQAGGDLQGEDTMHPPASSAYDALRSTPDTAKQLKHVLQQQQQQQHASAADACGPADLSPQQKQLQALAQRLKDMAAAWTERLESRFDGAPGARGPAEACGQPPAAAAAAGAAAGAAAAARPDGVAAPEERPGQKDSRGSPLEPPSPKWDPCRNLDQQLQLQEEEELATLLPLARRASHDTYHPDQQRPQHGHIPAGAPPAGKPEQARPPPPAALPALLPAGAGFSLTAAQLAEVERCLAAHLQPPRQSMQPQACCPQQQQQQQQQPRPFTIPQQPGDWAPLHRSLRAQHSMGATAEVCSSSRAHAGSDPLVAPVQQQQQQQQQPAVQGPLRRSLLAQQASRQRLPGVNSAGTVAAAAAAAAVGAGAQPASSLGGAAAGAPPAVACAEGGGGGAGAQAAGGARASGGTARLTISADTECTRCGSSTPASSISSGCRTSRALHTSCVTVASPFTGKAAAEQGPATAAHAGAGAPAAACEAL